MTTTIRALPRSATRPAAGRATTAARAAAVTAAPIPASDAPKRSRASCGSTWIAAPSER